MKINFRNMKKILFKTLAFFIAGVLIAMVLTMNLDTYSWFSKKFETNGEVTAATEKDIIENVRLETEEGNTKEIRIIKGKQWDEEKLVLYFSVEGEASKYIQHINPIILDENEYTLKIYPEVTLKEYLNILDNDLEKSVECKLIIRGYNDYVYKEINNIKFTYEYLAKEFRREIGLIKDNPIYLLDYIVDNIEIECKDIFEFIKDHLYEMEFKRVYVNNNRTQKSSKSSSNREIFVNKIELDERQKEIINIVAPGLEDYMDTTYKNLKEQIKELKYLDEEILQQQESYNILEEEKDLLLQKNGELEKVKNELSCQIETLKENKLNLEKEKNKQINDLKEEKNELIKEKKDIRIENNSLERRIEELQEEIKLLSNHRENKTVTDDVYNK